MIRGTAAASPTGRGLDRREATIAAVVAFAVCGIYIAIAAWHGALGAARNDDWSYYRIAFRFAEDGAFELNGWPAMMLVGQSVLAWPIVHLFGAEIAPLQIGTAALGACGLWACYLVIRRFVTVAAGCVAVACLALGPIYGTVAVSFMTDVPAFAFQCLALLAAARALRGGTRRSWFILALCLAFIAFSIREYSIAAGVAAIVVVLTGERRRLGRVPASLAVPVMAWLALVVAAFVWRQSLPSSYWGVFRRPPTDPSLTASSAWDAGLTIAFFIVPAVVAIAPRRLFLAAWDRAKVAASIVVMSWIVLVLIHPPGFVGNYFDREGASYPATVAGSGPMLLGDTMWAGLHVVAALSALACALLGATTVRARVGREPSPSRPPDPPSADDPAVRTMVIIFCICSAVLALWSSLTTSTQIFDRYVIALVPFSAALVLSAARRRRLLARHAFAISAIALVGMAAIGLRFVDASATIDGAKWDLAESMQERGYDPAKIDGGFEWFGFHQPDGLEPRTPIPGRSFWITLFDERPVCVTVSLGSEADPLPGADVPPAVIDAVTARSLTGITYDLIAVAGPQACDVAPRSA